MAYSPAASVAGAASGFAQPDIKSAISVLRQRLGNPYNKPRPQMGGGAGPQGIDPSAVVKQGGQQGIVGRGGNFQPLGQSAISKLQPPGGPPSGPVMAKPGMVPPGGGMAGPDGSSGRKPWQGGGVQQPYPMPPDFNPDAMRQAFERMTPEQQRGSVINIAGFPAPPNQTVDPSGGRGFAPPGDGMQAPARGGESLQLPPAPPGGGMVFNQPDPAAGRGFVPPTAGQPGAAPGLPPDIMAQINALRGGGGGNNYRTLMASALGNQLAY